MSKDDLDRKYREKLEGMRLGQLVHMLVREEMEKEPLPEFEPLQRMLRIKYLREEISRRETGRKAEKKEGKHGLKSVKSII